jgi:hypothetical protein
VLGRVDGDAVAGCLPLAADAAYHGCSHGSGEVAEFRGGQCGRAGIPGRAVEAAVKAVFEQIGVLGRAAADDDPVRPEDGQERRQADSDSLAVSTVKMADGIRFGCAGVEIARRAARCWLASGGR